MKLIIGSALALLLMGGAAYAQEPDKDKPKEEPKKEEGKKPEPKKEDRARQENEKRDEHAKPQENRTQEERNREQERSQQDRAREEERARQTEQHTDRDNRNANNQHAEHRGGGRRIPEEKFRVSFGREHHFHVRHDERRFSYGGYWFTYSDPWPAEWVDDDDVYIEEIDGEYYLYNVRHPGVRILVVVAD